MIRPTTRRSPARITVCVLLLLCILALMTVIFRFSSESKTDSGDRSGRVTETIAALIVPDYHDLPSAEQKEIVHRLHYPIRKLAHMSEYALLAVLTASLLVAWDMEEKLSIWKKLLSALGFSLLYAASDETHQIFSHRGASVTDVLIDGLGAVLGLALFWGVYALILRARRRKGVSHADHPIPPQL